MEPERTPPRARAHVRSQYLEGLITLVGGNIERAPEVTVSKKPRAADQPATGMT